MAVHQHSTPTRRRLLAGGAAVAAITAGASASAKRRDANCDGELIARCEALIRALEAYNNDPRAAVVDCDDCPFWQAYDRERIAVLALRATSLEGVRAKARVARALADQPEGVDFDTAFTGDFPGQVIEDLLRLPAWGLA
jgi:hypothetical protein